ncbi:hypothetical protein [Alcanivorax sp.]|uniref:hypothetical protein n=1 Tax=Alcanivorax sp. TaxID=1872427 RepID=UPI0025B92A56|nr:hypothetical protein [Alcanivorax sp.]
MIYNILTGEYHLPVTRSQHCLSPCMQSLTFHGEQPLRFLYASGKGNSVAESFHRHHNQLDILLRTSASTQIDQSIRNMVAMTKEIPSSGFNFFDVQEQISKAGHGVSVFGSGETSTMATLAAIASLREIKASAMVNPDLIIVIGRSQGSDERSLGPIPDILEWERVSYNQCYLAGHIQDQNLQRVEVNLIAIWFYPVVTLD